MRYTLPGDRQPPAVGGAQNPQTQSTPNAPHSDYSIPNSSVYLEGTAAANAAYEKAKAQRLADRNSLYHQYGLTDTGATDINNPYGEYQMLLGSEGRQLDSARNDAIGRGLGTGGLANQGEESLIPGIRLEQLGFQHSVDKAGADYATGLNNDENQRTGSIQQAYQNALQDALARGLFDPAPTNSTKTDTGYNSYTPDYSPPGATANTTAARIIAATKGKKPFAPAAVKVTANKTGASANKRQGIFSIH
jgi:hypothetical protein